MGVKHINASNGSGEAVKATVTVIRAGGSATIKVDSVTNWPAFFIATMGKLLSDNTLDPTTVRVFMGHLSGSDITIDTLAPGYSDALGSSVGDVVIIKPATMWADLIGTLLAVAHNDDGTLNTAAITTVIAGLSGKQVRLKPRLSTTTSTATLTANIDSNNIYELSAQAAALNIANPTGTPNDGDVLLYRLKDNGTSRAITYGTNFANVSGLSDLTATTISKWHYIGCQWNAGAGKWHIISITTGA